MRLILSSVAPTPEKAFTSRPHLLVYHPFRHIHLSCHRSHSSIYSTLKRHSKLTSLNMRTSISITTAIVFFLAMTGAALVNAQLNKEEQASLVQCQQNSRCAIVSDSLVTVTARARPTAHDLYKPLLDRSSAHARPEEPGMPAACSASPMMLHVVATP